MDGDSTAAVPTANVTTGNKYFAYPFSIDPLEPGLRTGLIAPGIFGTLSVVSTTILISFIVYRFLAWRKHYRTYIGYVSLITFTPFLAPS